MSAGLTLNTLYFYSFSRKVLNWHPPGGNGIRVDSHLYNGYKIPSFYDSLICKIIATGKNREESIMRMKRALGELVIEGVKLISLYILTY